MEFIWHFVWPFSDPLVASPFTDKSIQWPNSSDLIFWEIVSFESKENMATDSLAIKYWRVHNPYRYLLSLDQNARGILVTFKKTNLAAVRKSKVRDPS